MATSLVKMRWRGLLLGKFTERRRTTSEISLTTSDTEWEAGGAFPSQSSPLTQGTVCLRGESKGGR